MLAYEFSSVVEDNGIIHIPPEYLQNISSPGKVILIVNAEFQSNNGKKHFSAIKLKTQGFKFDRNAANER
jgi:hypothetical protein